MSKIYIYTLADKRPDFIPLQYKSFKMSLTDEYEFIVLNNAIDSKKHREEISRICTELGIECIMVKNDARFLSVGKQKTIRFGSYVNPNVACAYPINWAWQTMCDRSADGLFVIIDSDMFLCRPTSFVDELGDYDAAYVIQYRGLSDQRKTAVVTYPWNGICIFNPSKIPAIRDISWDCGVIPKAFIEGYAVDVGGYAHVWLKEHPIRIRHISEYAIHNFKLLDDTHIWLEATMNGNYHYSFSYNKNDKTVTDFVSHEGAWQSTDAVLPHLPDDFQHVLEQKTIAYFERFILDKQTYPAPTFLGLIEFETYNTTINPFIIHNKAGSGYMGFDANYATLKLAFIEKTLEETLEKTTTL